MKSEMGAALVRFVVVLTMMLIIGSGNGEFHDYGDALSKSILFFEGQRSGKLPPTQRLTWRKDSALNDGRDKGVDLTGGYYDAGDNVKFHLPMAFSTTVLAWGIHQYGRYMGSDLLHVLDALRWATDYFLKATAEPGVVYAQVGDPYCDHNCWQRPEDMDTPRTAYAVTETSPGSEVAAEIAAALAASSVAFRAAGDRNYSRLLVQRATEVFVFADRYRGSYNTSIGYAVCPFYCNFNGYEDELLWAATWLHRATKKQVYWDYLVQNIENFKIKFEGNILEFGWDGKNAGIGVLISKYVLNNSLENSTPFIKYADTFVCNTMPESPLRTATFSPGGLLSKPGVCNLQNTASRSFILLTYALYTRKTRHTIRCNDVVISPHQIIRLVKTQVDYILGDNPMKMSYMVGYSDKYPKQVHHRASSLPSMDNHPGHIACKDGTPYFMSKEPNPNLLVGAVVGGPAMDDSFEDDRGDAAKLEPTTYVNAPLVGLFAFFKAVFRQ